MSNKDAVSWLLQKCSMGPANVAEQARALWGRAVLEQQPGAWARLVWKAFAALGIRTEINDGNRGGPGAVRCNPANQSVHEGNAAKLGRNEEYRFYRHECCGGAEPRQATNEGRNEQ